LAVAQSKGKVTEGGYETKSATAGWTIGAGFSLFRLLAADFVVRGNRLPQCQFGKA